MNLRSREHPDALKRMVEANDHPLRIPDFVSLCLEIIDEYHRIETRHDLDLWFGCANKQLFLMEAPNHQRLPRGGPRGLSGVRHWLRSGGHAGPQIRTGELVFVLEDCSPKLDDY